jgi:hypothetical protein
MYFEDFCLRNLELSIEPHKLAWQSADTDIGKLKSKRRQWPLEALCHTKLRENLSACLQVIRWGRHTDGQTEMIP